MATNSGETLSDLERRAENNRAELAQTVDALYSRVTPDALKADARSYARDTGQQMLASIEARVRENPLQAMAVAAGLAYPVWRLIARMPAPVLLIGAGLAISRRGSGNGRHDVEARYRAAYDADQARAAGEAPGVLDTLKEKVGEVRSQLAEKAQETMESVRSTASGQASTAAGVLSDTYQSGREAAAEAVQRASETYAQARDNVASVIDRHPLLVGAAAFVVGSLVASSLPVTRPENRLMGKPSDTLKQRAQGMASQGLEQAKAAAQQVYETAAEGIGEEGLTPDVARSTARTAAEAARDAVEHIAGPGFPSQPGRARRSPRNS